MPGELEAACAAGCRIVSADVELFRVPLPETVHDAAHGAHTHFELPVVRLVTEDGVTGVGYTYTGGSGGRAIAALLEHDVLPLLIGADSSRIEAATRAMEARVHYVGRGGVASFAVSAADIALWDLRCRRRGEPLWRAVGGAAQQCRCYRGGIDLSYSRERLVDSVRGYVAEGHTAAKIKVGRAEGVAEDLHRLAAVRAVLGPGAALMADANMRWGSAAMARAAPRLRELGVMWLEEPIEPGDWSGYAALRALGVPLAQGENLHTLEEFRHCLARGCVDYVQPDASNCGGVTGWLKVAALAEAAGVPCCSHGMQELHASLVAGASRGGWVEVHSFPIDEYTTRGRLRVVAGRAAAPDAAGTGVEFDWRRLAPHSHGGRRGAMPARAPSAAPRVAATPRGGAPRL